MLRGDAHHPQAPQETGPHQHHLKDVQTSDGSDCEDWSHSGVTERKKWVYSERNGFILEEMGLFWKKIVYSERNGFILEEMGFFWKKWVYFGRNCFFSERNWSLPGKLGSRSNIVHCKDDETVLFSLTCSGNEAISFCKSTRPDWYSDTVF